MGGAGRQATTDVVGWLVSEPGAAAAAGEGLAADGTPVRWSAQGVSLGSAVSLAARGATLQVSRMALEAPRGGAIASLLRVAPAPQTFLVVEVRSVQGRVVLAAPFPAAALVRLPRLGAAPQAVLEAGALTALVDALRAGGAQLAHGSIAATDDEADAQGDGPVVTYEARRVWRGPVQLLLALPQLAVGAQGLAAAGVSLVWLGPALAVVPLVALLMQASQVRRHGGAPGGQVVSLVLLAVALVALGIAVRGPGALYGALLLSGTFCGSGGVRRWLHARQLWHRVRIDAWGVHGERRSAPRTERYAWRERGALFEAVVREGSQLFDRTSLLADALRLGMAEARARRQLLAARVAGEDLAEASAVREDEVLWHVPESRMGAVPAIVILALTLALSVVVFGEPIDWRTGALMLWAGAVAVQVWRTCSGTALDRRHRLWVQRVRRTRAPQPLYAVDRHTLLTATAVPEGDAPFVASGSGTSWWVQGAGGTPKAVLLTSEAEARALATKFNAFVAGGGEVP